MAFTKAEQNISIVKSEQKTDKFTKVQENLSALSREELLKYYTKEGTEVIQGLDNLGNFLMGFGILVLGYLLNCNLQPHFKLLLFQTEKWSFSSALCLTTWIMAVLFLLGFIYLFVFHLLAGRSIYAYNNSKNYIGKRIKVKNMSYEQYEKSAPTFEHFLENHYLDTDQKNDPQLWYATFRYGRFMAFKKLMIMNRMRVLLAWAMISGVCFKLLDIFIQST